MTISHYFGYGSRGCNFFTSINPIQLTELIGSLKEKWKREAIEENKHREERLLENMVCSCEHKGELCWYCN